MRSTPNAIDLPAYVLGSKNELSVGNVKPADYLTLGYNSYKNLSGYRKKKWSGRTTFFFSNSMASATILT